MNDHNTSRNLRGWFRRALSLEGVAYDEVKANFIDIVANHGFRITNLNASRDWVQLDAVCGSRIASLVFSSIPFIGQAVLWGKRLGLKAALHRGETVELNIDITPYMNLFNTSAAYPLSPSAEEKATDEYLAALKLHSITQAIYRRHDLPLPAALAPFDFKRFFSDTLLGCLIYSFDYFKSNKPIHFPVEKGLRWSWGAFIIPEFWYIWHEIWGVSMLFMLIEFAGGIKLLTLGVSFATVATIVLVLRIISGLVGNQIYYCKYGKWLRTPKRKASPRTGTWQPEKTKPATGREAAGAAQSTGEVKPLNKGEEWLRKGQFWPRKPPAP